MDNLARHYSVAEVTWRDKAKSVILEIDQRLGPAATIEERRKALAAAAPRFHCGASWLKQVWYEERRAYLGRHGDTKLMPSMRARILKAAGQGDIIFPFRGGASGEHQP